MLETDKDGVDDIAMFADQLVGRGIGALLRNADKSQAVELIDHRLGGFRQSRIARQFSNGAMKIPVIRHPFGQAAVTLRRAELIETGKLSSAP